MLVAVCHSASAGWKDVDDLSTLSELRAEPGNLLWAEADTSTLDPRDTATIVEEFGLHHLAVDDALAPRQRPKLEPYDKHLFVVFHQLDEVARGLEASQLACFVGDSWVVTIHAGCSRIIQLAKERWESEEWGAPTDPSSLLHTLLDVAVDDYERLANRLEDEVEKLEDQVLETPRAPVQRQLYEIKRQVARMRRYVLPLERVTEWVLSGSGAYLLPDADMPMFRDVHDHVLRIRDQVRNIDDLAQAVIDFTRSEQSTALNEVTKKLTGWAAIIAVPTLVASLYGMNFALIPDEQSLFGFFFAVAVMVACGVVLYVYFKRKGWI